MRWIDCVLFNGEPITKLRLAYLAPVVDVFYICEARYTHQGARKDILYTDTCREWFAPYADKVKFVVYEEPYRHENYERAHRDFPVAAILANEKGPYILSGCDIDELPDLRTMPPKEDIYRLCSQGGCVRMAQEFYYYHFGWRLTEMWTAPFFLNDTLLAKAQSLQRFRYHNPRVTVATIQCGWHFSYFQSIAEIQRKLESFCHSEYNKDTYKNPAHIRACIAAGKDLFLRNKTLVPADLSRFPQQIQDFAAEITALQSA